MNSKNRKFQIKILTPSKEQLERFSKEVVHKVIRIDSKDKVGQVFYRTMEEQRKINEIELNSNLKDVSL